MLQVIKCYNCGKFNQWLVDEKEPKWYSLKIPNPYIISPQNHGLTITVEFCSKECLNLFKENNEES